jgi:hypothetical protein
MGYSKWPKVAVSVLVRASLATPRRPPKPIRPAAVHCNLNKRQPLLHGHLEEPGNPLVAEAVKKVRSCEATNATTSSAGFAVGSTWTSQPCDACQPGQSDSPVLWFYQQAIDSKWLTQKNGTFSASDTKGILRSRDTGKPMIPDLLLKPTSDSTPPRAQAGLANSATANRSLVARVVPNLRKNLRAAGQWIRTR